MKSITGYWARIYCGTRIGYSSKSFPFDRIKNVCKEYCINVGIELVVTPTHYVYPQGSELGAIIEVISDPKNPKSKEEIEEMAIGISRHLLRELEQFKVTLITMGCPDQVLMIQSDLFKD
jgi:hypothetical protein